MKTLYLDPSRDGRVYEKSTGVVVSIFEARQSVQSAHLRTWEISRTLTFYGWWM